MTDYTGLLTRLESANAFGGIQTNYKEAAEAIKALVAERDAAFAMSKCECESNEACKNLVALHEEVTYLKECVSSHEKDKCSARESFGKYRTENQKLHKEITTLKYALCVALENICGAKLCEVNSMSSRQEMLRLMTKAIATIKEALNATAKT